MLPCPWPVIMFDLAKCFRVVSALYDQDEEGEEIEWRRTWNLAECRYSIVGEVKHHASIINIDRPTRWMLVWPRDRVRCPMLEVDSSSRRHCLVNGPLFLFLREGGRIIKKTCLKEQKNLVTFNSLHSTSIHNSSSLLRAFTKYFQKIREYFLELFPWIISDLRSFNQLD